MKENSSSHFSEFFWLKTTERITHKAPPDTNPSSLTNIVVLHPAADSAEQSWLIWGYLDALSAQRASLWSKQRESQLVYPNHIFSYNCDLKMILIHLKKYIWDRKWGECQSNFLNPFPIINQPLLALQQLSEYVLWYSVDLSLVMSSLPST